MRILSLNVWGGALREPLLAWLPTVEADVYCLQEVPRAVGTRSPWLTYHHDDGTALPQRADLYADLRVALHGHDGHYLPATRAELRDGDRPHWQEFGLATFVRSTMAVVGATAEFVHGEFDPRGPGPHPRPRNAHAVRVFDYATDRATTVLQLHGLREAAGKHDTPARVAQAERVVDLVRRVRRPDEPFVLCGDLNLLPEAGLFRDLAAEGLTDLVTAGGHTDTRTSHYAKPVRFADYLLVSPEVGVRAFDVVAAPEVSDHRALLLETF